MSLPTTSALAIESNRQNAQLSTGPRTAAGKARVGRNAVSHGLYANTLILTGEDADQLEALRQSIRDDLRPVTETESMLVERIIVATWKLRRAAFAEQALFELEGYANLKYLRGDRRELLGLETETFIDMPDGSVTTLRPKLPSHVVMAMSFRGKDPLGKMQLHEQRLENSIHRNLKQLRDLRKARGEPATHEDTPLLPTESDLPPLDPASPPSNVSPPVLASDRLDPVPPAESPTPVPPSGPLASVCESEEEAIREQVAIMAKSIYLPLEGRFDETNPNPALTPENQRPLTAAQVETARLRALREEMKQIELLRQMAFAPKPQSRKPKRRPGSGTRGSCVR